MRHALCAMPYALCSMRYALCPLVILVGVALQIPRSTVIAGLIVVMQSGMFRPLRGLPADRILRYGCAGSPFNGLGFVGFFLG